MNRLGNGGIPRLSLARLQAGDPAHPDGILQAVSLDLSPGRCLALLGDRQAGGSLLLDVVAGHRRSEDGQVLLDGLAIDGQPPGRRRVGMVSVRDPLFPHLSVSDNVSFPLRAQRTAAAERQRRVGEALALLGLEGSAQRRPRALDDAARIRAALARALVFDPRLILLDDPFALLDPAPRQLLQRTLRRLVRARGLTVLLVTADRDEALLLGDEIGILHAGRLHQVGTAQALLDRPADPVVAGRLGDANLLTGRIVHLDDEIASVRLSCGYEMEAEPGEALEEGMLCVLCVRPDRIATAFIQRPGLELGSNAVPATLLDAVHLVDHLRLRFRLADGSELLVRRPPAALASELRPDRPALLAWQPHHARVFAASP